MEVQQPSIRTKLKEILNKIAITCRPKTVVDWWKDDRREAIITLVSIGIGIIFFPLITGFVYLCTLSLTGTPRINILSCWLAGISKMWIVSCIVTIAFLIIIRVARDLISNQNYTDDRNVKTTEAGTYGTAGIMTPDEIRNVMLTGQLEEDTMTGPLYGKMINGEPGEVVTLPLYGKPGQLWSMNGNIFVVGGSNAGKSVTLLLNFVIQAIRRGESVIMSDPKLDTYARTASLFVAQGYEVYVFSTKRLFMKNSDRQNCLDGICRFKVLTASGAEITETTGYTFHETDRILFDLDEDVDQVLAQMIADVMMSRTTEDALEFWATGEMCLLKGMILYVVTQERYIKNREANISKIYELLVEEGVSGIDSIVAKLSYNHPAYASLKVFKDATDKVKPDVIFGLKQRLYLYGIRDVSNITNASDFNCVNAAKRKTAIFVGMDEMTGTFDFLSQLFFTLAFKDIIEYADMQPEKKCDVPVNFFFEEAANIGPIAELPRKISVVRSRSIYITIVLQSLSQLAKLYPDESETILSNCNTKIFIRPDDTETNDYIQKLGGIETILQSGERQTERTIGESFNYHPSVQRQEGEGKRFVINADEARRMKPDELLVFITGQNPMYLKKFVYANHFYHKRYFKEMLVQDRHPQWYVAQKQQADEIVVKQRRQKMTWLFFPQSQLWCYADGEVNKEIKSLPVWDPRMKEWSVDGERLLKQLGIPVYHDGQFVFAENVNLALYPQPPVKTPQPANASNATKDGNVNNTQERRSAKPGATPPVENTIPPPESPDKNNSEKNRRPNKNAATLPGQQDLFTGLDQWEKMVNSRKQEEKTK